MLPNYQYTALYILPSPANGFKTDHYYYIIILEDKENEGFAVKSNYGCTDDKEVNLSIRLSNMKSIERYFDTKK